MTDEALSGDPAPGQIPPEIDTSVATEARVYDYLLGGTNNYEVDRRAADQQGQAVGGIDNARHAVQANRLFLGRAVRYLASDAGIRQFLDIGTGIPTVNNVHQVAQALAPESRIVYVDYDPAVLAHARSLLTSTPEGATAYVQADLRHPETILDGAAATLDLTQPVAVMLISMLHFIRHDEDPYGIVERYTSALPSGSHLVISHMASDIQPEQIAALAELSERSDTMTYTFIPRSRDQVSRFFKGLELVEPGVVQIDDWRPSDTAPARPAGVGEPPYHAGVARKP